MSTSMRWPAVASVVAVVAMSAALAGQSSPPEGTWRSLEPGLDLAELTSPRSSEAGDSVVRVLRIDPAAFELRLLNASAPGQGERLTARDWCRRNDLVAAINASMYQQDLETSVSLMRTRTHVNNPRLSKDKTVLAFDALEPGLPSLQIIDLECQNFESLRERYGTLVQSIRMISCKGRNVWAQQPRRSSTAAIGTDREGRVLFIHVRSPYSTHDLIEILRELPIGLQRAMYAEGGPEAQLYVRSGEQEFEFVGGYETGLLPRDGDRPAWKIPNVVGVARRTRGQQP